MTTVITPRYAVRMDDRQETSRTKGSGEQQPARDRIVRSAATLVRERGVHGVGLRQIVAHADGPRGSLQRYFPGGKTQLITEALNLAGAEVLDDTESGLIEAATPAWGSELNDSVLPAEAGLDETHVSFTKGCYPGQEPIARLHYRGKVNRGLRVLEVGGAEPGDEIRYGDKVVGRVTSAVDDRALGYVRVEVPAEAEVFVGEKTGRTLSS